jgi:pimeloyl-ACP methyl ester carboxylesterase
MSMTPNSLGDCWTDCIEEPDSIPGVPPLARRLLRMALRAATVASPSLAAALALGLFTIPSRNLLGHQRHQRSLLSSAKAFRLERAGFDLQMYAWAGRGPTVVVTHGWSSNSLRLSRLIETLHRADFNVLAFDAPGHGESRGLRSSFPRYRDALRAVLEWAGGADAVVAHSLSARAAMTLLASPSPPRIGALALLAAPRDVRYMLEQFKVVLDLRPDVCRLLEKGLLRYLGEPPDLHRTDDVERLQLPILLVHDEHDDVAPVKYARNLARQLPHAHLLVTRGLNHCGVLCDDGVARVVVGFLLRYCCFAGDSCLRERATASPNPNAA